MGFIPEPTPEMDGYHVEVRRWSFYLRGEGEHTINVYGESACGTAELLIVDIPRIRAALDLVEKVAAESGG